MCKGKKIIFQFFQFGINLLFEMQNCWFQEQSTVAVSETEKYDKAILQRLFPEISLADKLVGQGGSLCCWQFTIAV